MSTNSAPSSTLGGNSMEKARKLDTYKSSWNNRTRMDSVNDPSFMPGSTQPTRHINKGYTTVNDDDSEE